MTTKAITQLRQRMIEDMNARKLCTGTQRRHIRASAGSEIQARCSRTAVIELKLSMLNGL